MLQITEIIDHYNNKTIAAQDTAELEGALTSVINLRWAMFRTGENAFTLGSMTMTPPMLQEIADCLFRILNTRYGCDQMTAIQ